jgi:hypothetical protein
MVFGEKGEHSVICALDESQGTGSGYDTVYVDENRNVDLTDEAPKRIRNPEGEPKEFTLQGSFREESVNYTLNIFTLANQVDNVRGGDKQYFYWYFWAKDHRYVYMFVGGEMVLFTNVADAYAAKPVRLAGACDWEMETRIKEGNIFLTAVLKDYNGAMLRSAMHNGKDAKPVFRMYKRKQVVSEAEVDISSECVSEHRIDIKDGIETVEIAIDTGPYLGTVIGEKSLRIE